MYKFPLVVLATLATVAGFIGFPHTSAKVPHWMHGLASWLEPSLQETWINPNASGVDAHVPILGHLSDGTTYGLMALALAIALVGVGIAWLFYGRGPSPSVDKLTEGPLHGAYEASKHKLWVDELYDMVIVRPFKVVAKGLYEVVDRLMIDTVAVNGVAMVVGLFGRVARWFQNGQVQRYLAGLVVGAAAVFFVTDCHEKPSFSYELVGDRLHLVAEPGAGLTSSTSKLSWDINGDGVADTDPKTGKPYAASDVYVLYGDVGAKVTLFIDDAVSRKTRKVTREIVLPATKTEETK